jgi:hypothetical protein
MAEANARLGLGASLKLPPLMTGALALLEGALGVVGHIAGWAFRTA